ncbi:Zinc finger protein 281 [Colletotrichum tropicale]|nr:Zinc finger protein 281 [Colletotrichum tropicale]
MELSRPFTCTECSQTFTRNENLERHKRSRHGSDSRRPFKCYTCRARFTRKDVCKRHSERCRGAFGRVLTVPGAEGEPEQTESVIDETALSSNGPDADDSPDANASVDTTVAMNDETYHDSSPETGGGTVSQDLLSSEPPETWAFSDKASSHLLQDSMTAKSKRFMTTGCPTWSLSL